ncbi:MAG: hypothetical protein G01um101418_413 [Parcubacteria group bacterium Gr01-1014_18]|nr:MAG: hypothetical protein Greene041636_341 [Parcubacteria group bacterium Greene0416_36]TSC81134.1 MAG: hypothetical protein G01um101418_413 [Parcubacteria group bacterium Gr01-1014_18]TSC98449.1 MAG: hypothetical protein Greene101420_686 [Parcubacteria group bacterium Greene1014_20]TSD07385.1 MAG: hypothetical protein Greene07142_240 [Parcubacteria group bacterium Greene0714_2]
MEKKIIVSYKDLVVWQKGMDVDALLLEVMKMLNKMLSSLSEHAN